jgi:hypothetical protein
VTVVLKEIGLSRLSGKREQLWFLMTRLRRMTSAGAFDDGAARHGACGHFFIKNPASA